jgi:23S rRNA pseudouridine2605 synthase
VRVFGRTFDDIKLEKIRKGTVMQGRKYGPYVVEVTNRQNTNTWLHMKLFTGKNNEIRRVMRKYSLRVNRLKRVSYGPFTLEQYIPNPGDLQEVSVTPELRKLMYRYYQQRTMEAIYKLETTQN